MRAHFCNRASREGLDDALLVYRVVTITLCFMKVVLRVSPEQAAFINVEDTVVVANESVY